MVRRWCERRRPDSAFAAVLLSSRQYRWCPGLKRSAYERLEVDRHRILPDGLPLDTLEPGDGGYEWGAYGDSVRR